LYFPYPDETGGEMMAITIADIQILIGGNTAGLQSSLSDAERRMLVFRANALIVGSALQQNVTAPIVAMGKAALKAGIEFDESMTSIKAVTGATSEEMEFLSDTAKAMSKNTIFSSKEAADGMLELLKAGVKTKDVTFALKGVLDLAAAGEISLSDAAIVASTSMNAFKKDMLTTSDVANILAGTAKASTTDVHGLRLGLSQASAVAAGLGLTFEDTATALGLFANNGLRGSDAGTSLKTMLLNLQPTTKKQKELFQELGLTTADGTNAFFDQTGKIKNLAGIASTLEGALAGMTDAQRLATLEALFGTDAIRAGNIIFKEGEKGVTAFKLAIGNVTAEEVAKTKTEALGAQIKMLKNDIERVGISVTEQFATPLKFLVTVMKDVISWFDKLNPNVKGFIVIVLGIMAAVGPILVGLAGLSVVLAALVPVATFVGTSVAGLIAGFLLIPIAIAAVIAIGISLYKNWDLIKTNASRDWKEITDLILNFCYSVDTAINNFIKAVVKYFSDGWSSVKTKTSAFMSSIGTFFTDGWSSIKTMTLTFVNDVVSAFKDGWNNMKKSVSDGWENIKNTIKEFIPKIDDIIMEFLMKLAYDFGFALGTIVKYFIDLPGKIIGAVISLRDKVIGGWEEIKDFVINEVPKMINSVITFFKELPGNVSNAMQAVWQAISDKWSEIKANTLAWLGIIWQAISDKWRDVAVNTDAWWASIVERVGNWLRSLPGKASTWLQQTWQSVSDKWRDIAVNTDAWWDSIVNRAGSWLKTLPGRVGEWLASLPGKFTDIWEGIFRYISGLYNAFYNVAANLGGAFWAGFKRAIGYSSPSYMERAFMAMADQAKTTSRDITALIPSFVRAGKGISSAFTTPEMGMMGSPAYGGSGTGSMGLSVPISPMGTSPVTTPETNEGEGSWGGLNVSVGQMVVREEVDILKVAQQLYRLQKDRTRGRGSR
jgi:TP901 family phage tail tape measure protein